MVTFTPGNLLRLQGLGPLVLVSKVTGRGASLELGRKLNAVPASPSSVSEGVVGPSCRFAGVGSNYRLWAARCGGGGRYGDSGTGWASWVPGAFRFLISSEAQLKYGLGWPRWK